MPSDSEGCEEQDSNQVEPQSVTLDEAQKSSLNLS